MSFLNFRSARRRAKKIVSLRHSRAPSPPSPGSFVSASAGEPTKSVKGPNDPHIDIDSTHRPFLVSDVLSIRDCRLATGSRDFQGGLLSKSLPNDGGLEQRKARVLALARSKS